MEHQTKSLVEMILYYQSINFNHILMNLSQEYFKKNPQNYCNNFTLKEIQIFRKKTDIEKNDIKYNIFSSHLSYLISIKGF